MKISFVNDDVFEDYNEWTINDKKIARKIMTLIKDISRNPYSGLGNRSRLNTNYQVTGRVKSPMSIGWFIKSKTMLLRYSRVNFITENRRILRLCVYA
jgi:hypothetical protein